MIGCTTQNCTYLFQRKKVGLTRYLCKKKSCVNIQILIWRPQDMICFNQLLLKHKKETWKTWEVCPFQLVVIFRRNFLLSMAPFLPGFPSQKVKKKSKTLGIQLGHPKRVPELLVFFVASIYTWKPLMTLVFMGVWTLSWRTNNHQNRGPTGSRYTHQSFSYTESIQNPQIS